MPRAMYSRTWRSAPPAQVWPSSCSRGPTATIFAWTGALRKRGELDGLPELVRFACQLEDACFDTLNEGIVTKDLVSLMHGVEPRAVNSREFLLEIRKRLEKRLGA